MQLDPRARAEYVDAFTEIVARIAAALANAPKRILPIRMYVAGGAALHFYTGERVSRDIDAAFSHRVALPENLDVAYRDADGAAHLLYFDRQYNESFALLHEDAHDDSLPLALKGVDQSVVQVRLLSPVDLAVSKIARLSDQDREDIASLARHGLVAAVSLRERAEQAMGGYVGDVDRLRTSIEIAVRIVHDASPAKRGAKRTR
jgi:uncharacterized nucleotidyltransferase DUF6036